MIGRILFALVFLIKSIELFFPAMINHAATMSVPVPVFTVPLFGVIALLGGLSILLGYKAKIGAWLIVVFLLPVTLMMHPFWHARDFFTSMMHQYCFLKNFALLGVALMIAYMGSGPISLEGCCTHKRKAADSPARSRPKRRRR